jgi:hypothetical protein
MECSSILTHEACLVKLLTRIPSGDNLRKL